MESKCLLLLGFLINKMYLSYNKLNCFQQTEEKIPDHGVSFFLLIECNNMENLTLWKIFIIFRNMPVGGGGGRGIYHRDTGNNFLSSGKKKS